MPGGCEVNLMATKKRSSSQHVQGGQIESITTVSADKLTKKGGAKILEIIISVLVSSLVDKILELILEAIIKEESHPGLATGTKGRSLSAGRGNKKKTTKALESKTDDSQELIKTVEALQERVKELEESRQCECQLRAKLEKNQGKKEEEISSAEMISKIQQLLQRIETLEERLPKLPESSA
uniref:uncharacterized protein LOC129133886 isoform X2 n=2 Tax=Agelaius phoeniceus TaxID=39638 RepID=UPI0023ED1696|nr:uncharacterized protein LOC129133886 isoform X2 [Agelaius phoeniceus]XP_054509527.1 uncharacterized protein LOC129133886 isoform X2 [Agelaius phoeniceus]XP_054509528.1 uncharacterized protein LOC129133886 isoform X2 [Agelaius phoeniceus]XP_054509529.1 uncharacterized protein LOC129133886 isoform X2 [Agelaius phoeniceus]XP_054509530.1 uncharacterized protein LOC129133886 isoform X2 [Agelaius phoeniceus]